MDAANHFDRLGLPRRFSVDPGELERAYLALARVVHPDFHLGGSDAEVAASLELSASVNEAYKTLRDPFARAEYILNLDGEPGEDEAKLPPAFLAEMLEAREQLETALRDARVVAALKVEFTAHLGRLANDLAERYSEYEVLSPGDQARTTLRTQIQTLLSKVRYVRRLITDLPAP